MSIEVPSQFTEDVKIEQSAKGARVTIHVFGNNAGETIQKAVSLYKFHGSLGRERTGSRTHRNQGG